MLLNFKVHYQKFGVRNIGQLVKPTLVPFESFVWPQGSVIHYLPNATDTLFIGRQPYFQNIEKVINVGYVLEHSQEAQGATYKVTQVAKAIRAYHLKEKDFKYILNESAALAVNTVPYAVNYGYLNELYLYRKHVMQHQFQWLNNYTTVVDNIKRVMVDNQKTHYLFFNIPKFIPTLQNMSAWCDKKTNLFYNTMVSQDQLLLFELFKFMRYGDKAQTVFNKFTEEELSDVNLVVHYEGGLTIVNLGFLHFIASKGDDASALAEVNLSQMRITSTQQFDGDRAAKYLLAVANVVKTMSSSLTKAIGEDNGDEETNDVDADEETVTDLDRLVDEQMLELTADEAAVQADIHSDDRTPEEIIGEALSTPIADANEVFRARTDREIVDKVIENSVTLTSISGSELKKILSEFEASDHLLDPYGSDGSILDAAKHNPEDVKLRAEDTVLPDSPIIFDKNMLRSRFKNFDRQYVEKLLKPQTLAMVRAFKRKGIVIKDYTIDRTTDLVGDYETHRISVKPIGGQPSTLIVRIPVISPEGEFLTNGNKYRLRKQNADWPIRKISPTEVTLSSYYGKLFIARASAAARSLEAWIMDQITKLTITVDESGEPLARVTNMIGFSPDFKAPRLYSCIGMNYDTVEVGGYHFNFNAFKRITPTGELLGPEETLKGIETPDIVLAGIELKSKLAIVMDGKNNIHRVNGGQLELIGDFYTLAGISTVKHPIEASELKLLGKRIPVIFVLGFYSGMTNVLKALGVKPKVIKAGKRIALEDHEFAIKFKDVSLVFNKGLDKEGLLVGGFDVVKKQLQKVNYSDFDKRLGYVNLMEDMGLNARYLTEMDDLDSLFVDPITEEKLVMIGEPKEFRKLLIRATELLVGDDHPHQVDDSVMQKRGYDRIPGAIYTAYIQSLRAYSKKRSTGKQKVDLNPWEVWKGITQDSALKIPEEINPLQNIKESESVTFVGNGGRSKESLAANSRIYRKAAHGVISEAGVDSGDIGVNTFLSSDAGFLDVYGTTKPLEKGEKNYPAIFSTNVMTAPEAIYDDQ